MPSCATAPRDFETPQGPRSGDQLVAFDILGVISRITSTRHRSSAFPAFEENATINVPPGTDIIVPAIRGWMIGYGATDPDDLTMVDQSRWHPEDHNFGLMIVNVAITRVNAVDNTTSPPSQTATVKVTATLSDDNSDDGWFAAVNYNLICLGRKPGR